MTEYQKAQKPIKLYIYIQQTFLSKVNYRKTVFSIQVIKEQVVVRRTSRVLQVFKPIPLQSNTLTTRPGVFN